MTTAVTAPALFQGLADELAAAVGGMVNAPAQATVAGPGNGLGWKLPLTARGDLEGPLAVWIANEHAVALAAAVLGPDPAPDTESVADMVRELWQQAISAVCLTDAFKGVQIEMGALEPGQPPAGPTGYEVRSGDLHLHITAGGTALPKAPEPLPVAAPASLPAGATNDRLDLVLDIDLPLTVRFARTTLPLKALAALGPGSIVNMGRSPDEPVQMLVGDRVIARGEVVVVSGNYGIRITDLVSPADRVRALEG